MFVITAPSAPDLDGFAGDADAVSHRLALALPRQGPGQDHDDATDAATLADAVAAIGDALHDGTDTTHAENALGIRIIADGSTR